MALKVFISWSGPRSHRIAEGLKGWLKSVIQEVEPWLSSTDIEKGSTWLNELSAELETTSVGIFCLTPENLESRWLNFEAGAIGIKLREKTRVCTYLYDIPSETAAGQPFGNFQATMVTKDDTRKLLGNINQWCERPLESDVLDNTFDKMWDDFDKVLIQVAKMKVGDLPAPRRQEDVIEEMAAGIRALLARDNSPTYVRRPADWTPVRNLEFDYGLGTGHGLGSHRFGDFGLGIHGVSPTTFGSSTASSWLCGDCNLFNPVTRAKCAFCGNPQTTSDEDPEASPSE